MTNDEKILQLRAAIKVKKDTFKTLIKFTPKTNCIIIMNGQSTNINVLKADELQVLAVRLHGYATSAKELGFTTFNFSGYSVADWLDDTLNKLKQLQLTTEKQELSKMEQRLEELLSADKRTELELDQLETLLKG